MANSGSSCPRFPVLVSLRSHTRSPSKTAPHSRQTNRGVKRMEPELLVQNELERDRLATLVEKLNDGDLAHDLGDGWTVGVALAHLAFWDERAALLLERYVEGTPHHHIPDWYEDLLNQTLEPQWRALPAREAATLAVAAAEHVTRALRTLDDDLCARLEANEEGYILRRFNHRQEHIDQIEAALK
jgi:hypothetical protein